MGVSSGQEGQLLAVGASEDTGLHHEVCKDVVEGHTGFRL